MRNVIQFEILGAIHKLEETIEARAKLECPETAGTDKKKAESEALVYVASRELFSRYTDVEMWSETSPETRRDVRVALMKAAECVMVHEGHKTAVIRYREEFNQFIWQRKLEVAPLDEKVVATA